MKKIVFLSIVVLAFINVTAQVRLGSSESDIRREFSRNKISIPQYTKNFIKFITIEFDDYTIIYYLDGRNICTDCILIPDTQGALNSIVERYNSQYTIISDTQWKMYSSGGIMYIELIFEDNGYYFMFYNYE